MITNENSFQLLPESFYKQPTLTLAKQLIGKILVHETEEGLSSGVIVETEAYLGALDRAAHSYGYRRTKRTEIMYHQAGLIYTYQMHTHCLLNIVSGEVGEPEAVLIRAIEPYSGVDLMMQKRPVKNIQNLTSGPGKLTKALGITMQMYGKPIYKQPLYITEGARIDEIMTGLRIGISNTEEARDYPYRFWMAGNSYVSR
ncbi:DNA-3-methyladenine glycosylase [Oceanobacillus alkalisoli]|uniref:DNA-3-methyladenine glycosylase n=1 Tax=Oceanobacillus alkalisoli TaxID=2925113 RepID=UPI001EE4084D|nr:DNA-3-methyladenine glycosylase [Oceanobacillus alkalisoli]MCG5103402.1 DNA-3-methyladenine glycosylase [Oceanobacillus alkalisoli]